MIDLSPGRICIRGLPEVTSLSGIFLSIGVEQGDLLAQAGPATGNAMTCVARTAKSENVGNCVKGNGSHRLWGSLPVQPECIIAFDPIWRAGRYDR